MKYILDKLENKICTLTVNRPAQFNALNMDALSQLDDKLDWVINETDARVVILTGMGEKAFIAGADIEAMQKMNKSDAKEFSKIGQDITIKIEEYSIPIIAAVNGFALGGGCELAMACHIRYASNNAVFGQPEVSLGLIAGWGGSQRLPKLVGKGKALEILLSGKNISAELAEKIGLINKVVPGAELIPAIQKLAHSIIKNAPLAISSTLKAVNYRDNATVKDALKYEKEEFSSLFNTDDTLEGLTAFIEKRTAKYTGK